MEIEPHDFRELRMCDDTDDTILDILNTDCWRIILDYVPINDIVRSECVSRAWQRVVCDYLAGVHNYRIENLYLYYYSDNKIPPRYWNYRNIDYEGDEILFNEMIQKMGPSFVKIVVNCIKESNLRAIALHCPHLEALTLYRTFRYLPLDHVKKCKQLKQIQFDGCGLREDYLSEMITSETIEELIINNSGPLTGRFLTNLKKYLKTLGLNRCEFLLFKYIKSAENYLTKLTRLELNGNSSEILQNVHLLLDKTPDLEHLSLMKYLETELGDELPAVIGRLSRLKEVHLWGNKNVTDEWVTGLARGCPALRTVNVGFCRSVSPAGLLALCRTRPALVELVVAGLKLTEADLEAYAHCCGGLRLLDVAECSWLTRRLLERIAGPRAHPLLLRLGFSLRGVKGTHYEGLALRWNNTTAPYYPNHVTYYDYIDRDSDYDDDDSDYQ